MSEQVKEEHGADGNKKQRIVSIISSVIDKVGQDKQLSLNSILVELRDLLMVIEETRQEIGMARPSDIKGKQIAGATDELSAIIDATSEATGTIMDCCDVIQEKAASAGGEDGDAIVSEVMKIYEACSFQDITGQRVSKVMSVFADIESKIDQIVSAFGLNIKEEEGGDEDTRVGDERLLNGPQMPTDAISQDDIDKLLAEFD